VADPNNSKKQKLMKMLLSPLFATVVALGALLTNLDSASAQALPVYKTATGDFNTVISDNYTDLGTYGGVNFLREDLVFKYAGDITGTATDVNFLFVNPDGSFQSFAQEVCKKCTIDGRKGTFTAQYMIIGNSFTDYTGYLVFTGGTGGLQGLQGYGTFGYNGVTTFYTYHYYFAE
jgi:Protein of unknown function (DUF3224)